MKYEIDKRASGKLVMLYLIQAFMFSTFCMFVVFIFLIFFKILVKDHMIFFGKIFKATLLTYI